MCGTLASTANLKWGAPLYLVINSHLRMHLQIWRQSTYVHNALLLYLNSRGSWYPTSLTVKIWLVHYCQTEEDHLFIKIVTALLLYNAYTILNMMEM